MITMFSNESWEPNLSRKKNPKKHDLLRFEKEVIKGV